MLGRPEVVLGSLALLLPRLPLLVHERIDGSLDLVIRKRSEEE